MKLGRGREKRKLRAGDIVRFDGGGSPMVVDEDETSYRISATYCGAEHQEGTAFCRSRLVLVTDPEKELGGKYWQRQFSDAQLHLIFKRRLASAFATQSNLAESQPNQKNGG